MSQHKTFKEEVEDKVRHAHYEAYEGILGKEEIEEGVKWGTDLLLDILDLYKKKMLEAIQGLRVEVPKKPKTHKGFIYGLTDKWINKVILYAGRVNYNKALEDVEKQIIENI